MSSGTVTLRVSTRVLARPRFRVSLDRVCLAAIVLLSTVLSFLHLDQEGYANTYYAATVKSMLLSWHNFFFVSSIPADSRHRDRARCMTVLP